MKHLTIVLMVLLIPTTVMAKGECKADIEKFCSDIGEGKLQTCLNQHQSELSAECKAKREAKAKAQSTGNEKKQ
jgi:hypothetical protein